MKVMVAQIQTTTPTEIFYPDCDGQPMANNTTQFRWIVAIKQNLERLFAGNPRVFIAGDLFWYPIEGRNTIAVAPDVMVVFDRPKGDRLSYKQWVENNIPPQVIFEILSPSNTKTEMDRKLLFFDRYGVEEYYIYNPDTNELRGWLRGEEGLDELDPIADWVSPRMGIRFDLSGEELQFIGPDGRRFISYAELDQMLEEEQQRVEEERQRAEEERQRAEEERQRAEEEHQRAEEERQRAEEAFALLDRERQKAQLLAEHLRSLGIDPDELT